MFKNELGWYRLCRLVSRVLEDSPTLVACVRVCVSCSGTRYTTALCCMCRSHTHHCHAVPVWRQSRCHQQGVFVWPELGVCGSVASHLHPHTHLQFGQVALHFCHSVDAVDALMRFTERDQIRDHVCVCVRSTLPCTTTWVRCLAHISRPCCRKVEHPKTWLRRAASTT